MILFNSKETLSFFAIFMDQDNINNNDTLKPLTKEEKNFCKLFMLGEHPYAGNAVKCYKDVFNDDSKFASSHAKKLLKEPHIKAYIEELKEESLEEAADIKRYLTHTLRKVIDECSTTMLTDRHGNEISQAGMRSVAVNAAKALADLYPVKQAQVSKLTVGGEEGSNAPSVTFNVIVPGAQSDGVEIKEEKNGENR